MPRLKLPSTLFPEPPPPPDDRTDVLVLGGGMAGLCAAIAARRAGARVILAEQAPRWRRGGNARHARNIRVPHDAPTALSPGRYPEAVLRQDLERVSGGTGDPILIDVLANHAGDLPAWLAQQGVLFQSPDDGVLPWSRKTVFLLGGGTAMMNALYDTAERLGVHVLYEAEGVALDLNGAARLRHRGRVFDVDSRATILATGGYQANRAWLRETWGRSAEGLVVRGTPFARGILMRALIEQGAQESGEPGGGHLVAVDARSPEADGGIVTRIDGLHLGLAVNQAGRRFFDEGEDTGSTRYGTWGRQVAGCAGQRAFVILDARGKAALLPLPVFPPLEAPSLPALAQVLGLDPETLVDTVTGYNRALTEGHGTRWRRLNPPRTPPAACIEVPPFHALPFAPGITFTGHGLYVDERARVLRRDGFSCPTLYAAGMTMGPALLGSGYVSGVSLTLAAVFGRIAGWEAASHVRVF
ncbi:FAD-dependent tricarballylate dehydrogenase TcuA [Pararhodospirillum oryzae]|uniref:Tricarballylate dehydrogenase n=1 Tax=Pararhodospirillum oryzae TaxID=478448 RepID=A0A512H3Q8_9PROT|nr:FAD-dependent tricarballylate dehydrogenase TcuA [Pararhodospirillum oryzae]GEO80102.1 tricarballylate dehydrogenase [Pararhodospirillum oryzae]